MPYSVKGFFEIDEDMVQILLVLEVLFTQDSEVEDLFCGASSGIPALADDIYQHLFLKKPAKEDQYIVISPNYSDL